MNRLLPLLFVFILAVPGCSRGVSEPSNIDQAGPALRTALETWKGGSAVEDLAQATPSIIMNETEWASGKRLADFKMEEKGSMLGRQVRWQVQLKLKDKDGRTVDRRATYIIDTTPRIVIVRDLFGS
jgi:hypothetical protein